MPSPARRAIVTPQRILFVHYTDHSKALTMSKGLDEARAVAFARQVREINKKDLGI